MNDGDTTLDVEAHRAHHRLLTERRLPILQVGTPSGVKYIGRIAQVSAAAWILNVWFNRFGKDTGYRGGEATNMKEEFQEYGFSENQMYAVGATKVGLAIALLIGLVVPKVVRPAALGLAAFMAGAIGMHVKVGDPIKRSAPAITVLGLSSTAALLADRR